MPIIEIRSVSKTFRQPGAEPFKAVDNVSLYVEAGESLALVGESGSGKSTVAKIALSLIRPDSGEVLIDGVPVSSMSRSEFRHRRLTIQPVFQDATSSFNPRRTIWSSMQQAILQSGRAKGDVRQLALELLSKVELRPPEDYIDRFPHELSGGQRQRLAIGRALALRPRVLIADEPLSGADVSIRAQLLNLLVDLQAKEKLGYLLITHDMLVARAVAHRVAVMYRGRIVEEGPTEAVMSNPQDAYTKRLLMAVHPVSAPKAVQSDAHFD